MNLLFGFQGRIGRLQWWFGQLAIVIWFIIACMVLVAVLDPSAEDFRTMIANRESEIGASVLVFILAVLIISTWMNAAVTIKRFHDRNKSGFWFFIVFVPYAGVIWQLVECGFLPGTPGGNDYGQRGDTYKSSSRYDYNKGYQPRSDLDDVIAQHLAQHQHQSRTATVERTRTAAIERKRPVSKGKPVFGKRG